MSITKGMDFIMIAGNWKDSFNEQPQFGCFITFDSVDLTEMSAALGFDFIVLDDEHGVLGDDRLASMVRACQCRDVPAIVRCAENSYDHVQKALDFGANGVQIPLVNTVEDAEKVVRLSSFPPMGKRGVSPTPRSASYGIIEDMQAYMKEANLSRLVSVHIETLEAVTNLDDILRVEGIDVFFIGPGDLSASMGLPRGARQVQDIVRECIKKISDAGKIAGVFTAPNAEAVEQAVSWGARYIATALNSCWASAARNYLAAGNTALDKAKR